MLLPGVIIFVNNHWNLSSLDTLATRTGIQPNELVPYTPPGSAIGGIDVQLQITETIFKSEFDARVKSNPNYPKIVRLSRQRILVILHNFQDICNRELADVVMFVKQGVTSVEKCKYGEPGFTLDNQRLNIFNLLFGIKHQPGTIFCFPCEDHRDGYYHHRDGYFCPPEPPCPGTFPPPICPPQTQTLENPRPPEHLHYRPADMGLGALELYGVEALEKAQGPGHSVFGPRLDDRGSTGDGGEFGEDADEGEV